MGASLVLAWQPVAWLVRSWVSPAYGSHGWVYALLILALVARSVASGAPRGGGQTVPLVWLLVLAAGLRLAGQMLAVNILGALALAVDIFALVGLFGLARRPFALSPFWIAMLFLFTLPVETLMQRILGFPLQLLSADGACAVLSVLAEDVECAATRLSVAGKDVLVDLPCSGTGGLMLALALCVVLNAIYRPRFGTGCLALAATVGLAVCGNVLRITLLALGITHEDATGIDVMGEPWHSAIGLVTLALSVSPLLLLYRPRATQRHGIALRLPRLSPRYRLFASVSTLIGAVAIVQAKAVPVDVSGAVTPRALPAQIGGHRAEPMALTAMEREYFTRYGGEAMKASYGAVGLNVVSTRSPLRHLHGPEACLRGLGYSVRFLGTRFDGDLPSAIYQASKDGRVWNVAVSYVSSDGDSANGVAEAIWRWLRDPGATWSSVQRITPATLPEPDRIAMDAALLAALDIATVRPALSNDRRSGR